MQLPLTKVFEQVPGAEGPVFDRSGRFMCVAPPKGSILRQAGDKLIELANTGGIPAGLQLGPDGWVWIADMKLGILRVSEEGRLERIVSEYDRQPIRGCNDLAFDSRGNLYFTAPAGSDVGQRVGEIFCRLSDGRVIRLDGGFAFCNGIAVSPDNSTLIVAETFTKRLWRYSLIAPGKLRDKQHWATLPGEHFGGPDGIDFDAAGNLLAANWGGSAIEVFDGAGKLMDRLILPFERPSNLHFGGEEGRDLWITEHTGNAVWRTQWHTAHGMPGPKQG